MIRFLSLALLLPWPALAADSVKVRWDVNFTTQGRVVEHRTPEKYLQSLEKCGHQVREKSLDHLPVSILRCEGILNFSESASIRKTAQDAIRKTIRSGKTNVAGLSLSLFVKQSKSVDFALSPYGIFESAADSRNFAVNLPKQKLVILNGIYWEQIKNSPDNTLILLHELLGALGYDDSDYNYSIEIAGKGGQNGTLLASREDSGGGASVVGNGGDSNEAMLKATLILWAKQMKLDTTGLENRKVPSRKQLEKFFTAAPLTLVPTAFMKKNGLCEPMTGGAQSQKYCGAVNEKGLDGRPTILITEDIGDLSPQDREQLLLLVFQKAYCHLLWKNEGK